MSNLKDHILEIEEKAPEESQLISTHKMTEVSPA